MRRLGWAVCWQPRPSIAACRLGLDVQARLAAKDRREGVGLARRGQWAVTVRRGRRSLVLGEHGGSWGYHALGHGGTRRHNGLSGREMCGPPSDGRTLMAC